jgi:hypothetical protein
MMRNLVKDGFEVVGYDIAEQAMARLAEAGHWTRRLRDDCSNRQALGPGRARGCLGGVGKLCRG